MTNEEFNYKSDYKLWVIIGKPDTFLTWWAKRNNVSPKDVPHGFFKFLIGQTDENLIATHND